MGKFSDPITFCFDDEPWKGPPVAAAASTENADGDSGNGSSVSGPAGTPEAFEAPRKEESGTSQSVKARRRKKLLDLLEARRTGTTDNFDPNQSRADDGKFGSGGGGHGDKKGHELEHAGHVARHAHEAHEVAEAIGGGLGASHNAVQDAHDASEAVKESLGAKGLEAARAGHAKGKLVEAAHDDPTSAGAIVARHLYKPALRAVTKMMEKVPGARVAGRAISALHDGANKAAEAAVSKLADRYGHATAAAILGSGAVLSGTAMRAAGVQGPLAKAIPAPHLVGAIPMVALAEAGKRLGVVGHDTKLERGLETVGSWIHAVKSAASAGASKTTEVLGRAGHIGARMAGRVVGALLGNEDDSPAFNREARPPLFDLTLNLSTEKVEALGRDLVEALYDAFEDLLEEHVGDLNAAKRGNAGAEPTGNEFREADHPRALDGRFSTAGTDKTAADFSKAPARRGAMMQAVRAGVGKDAKITLRNGRPAPDHIKPSMVAPDWKHVEVSLDPDAELLVKAVDNKGRIKSVYSDAHALRTAAVKFARVDEMIRQGPAIDREIQEARSDPKTREQADCAWLMSAQATRPGSKTDTGAKVKAYGATTLEGRHVIEDANGRVRLHFVGKEGVLHDHLIRNPELAKMLLARKRAAGDRGALFKTSETAVNNFIGKLDGGHFSAKDFRTRRANLIAVKAMRRFQGMPKDDNQYKARVKAVAYQVSTVLGNKPAQCLESYINPTIFSVWQGMRGNK